MPGKSGKYRCRRKPPEEWAIRGRPPTRTPRTHATNVVRPYAVTMICTLEEREAIVATATECGLSLSAYLRALVWPPEPEEPAA